MIHKLPTNKRSVLGWLCRREMRQNLKKKRVKRKSGKDRRKPRSYLWRKKNQDSISLMKWSSSQLLKTFCWIATGTPTLIESISVLQLMYKMYFKGNTLSYDAIYIKHEINDALYSP